jgi:hypothetical protein
MRGYQFRAARRSRGREYADYRNGREDKAQQSVALINGDDFADYCRYELRIPVIVQADSAR